MVRHICSSIQEFKVIFCLLANSRLALLTQDPLQKQNKTAHLEQLVPLSMEIFLLSLNKSKLKLFPNKPGPLHCWPHVRVGIPSPSILMKLGGGTHSCVHTSQGAGLGRTGYIYIYQTHSPRVKKGRQTMLTP